MKDTIKDKFDSIKNTLDKSNLYNYRENLISEIDKARKDIERDFDEFYRDGVNDMTMDNPWLMWVSCATAFVFGFALGIILGAYFL